MRPEASDYIDIASESISADGADSVLFIETRYYAA